MKVLALLSDIPFPPNTGSRVRNFHLWSALRRQGIEVKILGLSQAPVEGGGSVKFASEDAEFFALDRPPFIPRAFGALTRSFHERPRSSPLWRKVREVIEQWKPDIVHAEELRMANYACYALGLNRERRPKVTVTAHNVESELLKMTGSAPFKWGAPVINWLHLRALKTFEKSTFESFDLSLAYSALDRDRYQKAYPKGNWYFTRNGADVTGVIPSPQVSEPKILFVGSLSYAPNLRGLRWFLDEVLTKLSPEITLTVAGSRATPEVKNLLTRPRVNFIDSPVDLAPIYQAHALSIVPVFEGSGTRGKILESLAHERILVSTTLGAEGLGLTEKEGVICRDDSLSFAREIEIWVKNREGRSRLGSAGRQKVHNEYDWQVVARELKEAWERSEYKLY